MNASSPLPEPDAHRLTSPSPLVSVIIIFLNEQRFLEEAIRSVFAQTFSDWELILVDDGSTDSSPQIAARFQAAHPERVRIVRHAGGINCGMSASRNLGLAVARGELIAFLDGDDVYLPRKLEVQVGHLRDHPSAGMVYGATQHWYSWTGRKRDDRDQLRSLGVTPNTLVPAPLLVPMFLRLDAQTPGTCGLLVRRAVAESVGGFDERFRGMFEDQVFIFKICLTHEVFVEGGSWDRYRKHPDSHTKKALASGRWSLGQNPAHREFLDWLEVHLADMDIHDGEVRSALGEQTALYDAPLRAHRPFPPKVDCVDRPMWSVMIPTYNCARFLRTTLLSVIDQDPGRQSMQIEVVDDCSQQDDPRAVVTELGSDRVQFFAQPRNVGHTRNFNTCLARSSGHLIHLLHGDDMVLPGFYERMHEIFAANPDMVAAFCRHKVIDETGQVLNVARQESPEVGVIPGWFERIAVGQRLQPPAMVVRRSAYEEIGGFDQRIAAYGEDWEMWTRLAAHGPVGYVPSPLACYRVHTNSISSRTLRTGENMHDIRMVIEMIRDLMPAGDADDLVARSKENNALGALRRGLRLFDAGDHAAAYHQFREAVKTSHSPTLLRKCAELAPRVAWRAIRQTRYRLVGTRHS